MAQRTGMLTVPELQKLVDSGEIDTVIISFTDMQGRLVGKRMSARLFVEDAIERGERVELPPVLYVNGTVDKAHPRPDLDRFVANYRMAGGRVDLNLYEGEAEGFMTRNANSAAAAQARDKVARFVQAELS